MIKVEELRISNLVEYHDLYYSVRGMQQMYNDSPYDLILRDDHDLMFQDVEVEECKPISITEEWLLRMGFEKRHEDLEHMNVDYSNKSQYWVQHHIDFDDYVLYGRDNSVGISLKHVHQLQNLYHSLTGKELEIKG